jgi:uncharacterized protein (DUF4213/DUF364 family)
MDNTRTVTDAKQQKIKIKKDVITSSMSTIVDRTCYVFFFYKSRARSQQIVGLQAIFMTGHKQRYSLSRVERFGCLKFPHHS